MNSEIDLTGLKDLHYPVPPSWWPPAWGWFVVAGGVLGVGLFLLYKKRTSSLSYALKELKKMQTLPTEKRLKTLSQLLKRVAMVRYGRAEIAPLDEEAWQQFLLAAAPNILTKDQAEQLAYAIYNPNPQMPSTELLSACQKWIENVLKKK